jgi:hypothetical protein
MKIDQKKNIILPYSWLPTGTYHKNLANFDFIFKKLILDHFFIRNPLYRCKILKNIKNLGVRSLKALRI